MLPLHVLNILVALRSASVSPLLRATNHSAKKTVTDRADRPIAFLGEEGARSGDGLWRSETEQNRMTPT